MTWLQKLLPPRIKRTPGERRTPVPEGLWVKCPACEAVLYRTDLENNLNVCPKCAHHARVPARERIEQLLDPEGRFGIGSEVVPVDSLKFRDQKKYPDRLAAALEETGETDALVLRRKENPDPGLFDVIAGSVAIMQDRITRSRMAGEPPDILITPRVGHIALMDFDRAGESIAEGRKAARLEQAEIGKLARALER